MGNARFQQGIALYMLKRDLADLNPKHNKGRYEEVQNAILEFTGTPYLFPRSPIPIAPSVRSPRDPRPAAAGGDR